MQPEREIDRRTKQIPFGPRRLCEPVGPVQLKEHLLQQLVGHVPAHRDFGQQGMQSHAILVKQSQQSVGRFVQLRLLVAMVP